MFELTFYFLTHIRESAEMLALRYPLLCDPEDTSLNLFCRQIRGLVMLSGNWCNAISQTPSHWETRMVEKGKSHRLNQPVGQLFPDWVVCWKYSVLKDTDSGTYPPGFSRDGQNGARMQWVYFYFQ
jgi:hypothetical protein